VTRVIRCLSVVSSHDDDHTQMTTSIMNYVQARAGEGGQGDEGEHFMEELFASLHVHEAVSPIRMSSSCHMLNSGSFNSQDSVTTRGIPLAYAYILATYIFHWHLVPSSFRYM
jgi:hypothetical protein